MCKFLLNVWASLWLVIVDLRIKAHSYSDNVFQGKGYINAAIFWDIRGPYVNRVAGPILATCYTLVSCSAGFRPWRQRWYVLPKLRFTYGTRRHIPEDGNIHNYRCENLKSYKLKLNSIAWVRERTIPTERLPIVGKVSANFWGLRVPRGQRDGSLEP
jgi:hypothetical protein